LILKIALHYTAYREKMQSALGPEQICETLYQYLSKVLTIKKFKLHDVTYRKKLFTLDGIEHRYPLVRVKITYVVKNQLVTTTWAFNRFLTSGIVVGLEGLDVVDVVDVVDVGSWLKTEKRSFALLVKFYRKRFFPGKLFLRCPFRLKLIE
jgi:hypothetical protein